MMVELGYGEQLAHCDTHGNYIDEQNDGDGCPWCAVRDAAENLAELEQTTGDLCPVCGWSTLFPDGCSRCERSRLEATIEAARPVMRTVYVLRRGGWTAITLHKLCDLADNLPDDQRAKWEE